MYGNFNKRLARNTAHLSWLYIYVQCDLLRLKISNETIIIVNHFVPKQLSIYTNRKSDPDFTYIPFTYINLLHVELCIM